MVPRGGVELPTLRFSEAALACKINYLALEKLEKHIDLILWMAKPLNRDAAPEAY